MKAKLIIYILLTCIFTVSAQELKVTGFRAVPMDLSASTHMRRDANNTPCALVKVVLRAEGASFEGNIVGDTQFRTNEYWVYLTEGTKMLQIKHISANPTLIRFYDYGTKALSGKSTYILNIELPVDDSKNNISSRQTTEIRTSAIAEYNNKNYVKALELFLNIPDDAQAQNYIGIMYRTAKGVEQNNKIAAEWFFKSAEQGLADAQNNLGFIYEHGYSVEKSVDKAIVWYKNAAEQNLPMAQFNLARLYEDKKEYANAALWYRNAAEQGYASAQNNLGALYFDGKGVQKSHADAVFWYRKAAEQGDDVAQFNLGECYYNGTGVKKDKKEARKWIKLAADNGYWWATRFLNNNKF
ncbi:tetratricopeptide repeat protein [uncultured Muribaculum sp.]|uniref:tetratricopeptide repeat protein n=1 Tax=uncultured Muribaculum sp. TaxID=1918613 RepID=UPI00267728FF|nr:tetratricopeptide repeat protein [uncultured Muribaculum sp.]